MSERNRSDNEILTWVNKWNKEYKELKQNGQIDDIVMVQLSDTWRYMCESTEGQLPEFLAEKYQLNIPILFSDIMNFSNKYHEAKYNETLAKMDDIEKAETESLSKAIWDKNVRMDVICSMFDWNKDDYFEFNMTLPRLNRDKHYFEFKNLCAITLYNRGSMLVKFYVGRGRFEYTSFIFEQNGRWDTQSKAALQEDWYSDSKYAFGDGPGESVLEFERDLPAEPAKFIYFNR